MHFFAGIVLNFNKSAGVKDFTNIPSAQNLQRGQNIEMWQKHTDLFNRKLSTTASKEISDKNDQIQSRHICRPVKAAAGPIQKSVKEQTKTLNEQVTTLANKTQFWRKRKNN